MPLYYALKSCKNIKLQNIVRFCKDFIIRLVTWHLKACTSKFATQNVLASTTMVLIISWNSPCSFELLNGKLINGAYTWRFIFLGGGFEPFFAIWPISSYVGVQIVRELVRLMRLIGLNKFWTNVTSPMSLKKFSRTTFWWSVVRKWSLLVF